MKYQIFFTEKAVKELKKITGPHQKLIAAKIKQLGEDYDSLANNIKPLKGKYEYYRLRVGSYRVIFHKDDDRLVITILRIGHRKDIYDDI